MPDTDDALRRQIAEIIRDSDWGCDSGWSSRAADALLVGPIAKHTAALQAENTSLRAERDELIAKIALSVALKREKAELEAEVQRLLKAMTGA